MEKDNHNKIKFCSMAGIAKLPQVDNKEIESNSKETPAFEQVDLGSDRCNLSSLAGYLFKYAHLTNSFAKGKPIWHIGIYVRLSKEDQRKHLSASIEHQVKQVSIFLNDLDDFVVYEIYIDDGRTGTDFERDDYIRMCSDIKKGNVNCVIVIDLTRYARNLADGVKELDAFVLDYKIRFISIDNPEVDTLKDPQAISSSEVYSAFAAAEDFARLTSKKVRKYKYIKCLDGEKNGGFPPYGYLSVSGNEHWVIDPVAAVIVKQMFLWAKEGLSDRAIAMKLNEQNIPCPSLYKRNIQGLKYESPNLNDNALWRPTTIGRILRDKTYIGCSVQGKSSSFDHKRHKATPKKREDYIVVPGCHEPIVSDDLFNVIQEIKASRTRTSKNGKVHIFANLVYCADCKRAMMKNNAGNYLYLVCRTYKELGKVYCDSKHTIRFDVLENIVLKTLQSHISLVADMQELIKKINCGSKVKTESERLAKLVLLREKEITRHENLLDESYSDWKTGDISREQYLRIAEKAENELKKIKMSISAIQAEQKRISEGITEHDSYFQRFLQYQNIETLNREICVELIDKIYINKDQSVIINLKYKDQFELLTEYIEQNTLKHDQKTLKKK